MVGLLILFIAAGLLTTAWLGGALVYVSSSVGWDNLFLMMPNDLALFAFGVFGPVALLWLVLGLVQTTLSNHRQEGVLRQMVVQERRSSDQIEAQVRTLIQMQGESRRRSVIDGMDLVLKDLNGQAAVLAERLGMVSQDEADTLWGRTVAGDVWAFSYAFLTRAEAYEDFPDLLAERLAQDEISSSALQLFLRRYDLLLESFRETDADKLARAVLEDGPLARLHSLFAAVNLRAVRMRQGYAEVAADRTYGELEGQRAMIDPLAQSAGYYPEEEFHLDPEPEARPRFGVEDFPDDFGVPLDDVRERELFARDHGSLSAAHDEYASEPLAQEGYAGNEDFQAHNDDAPVVDGHGYDYAPLPSSARDDLGLRASALSDGPVVGGYGRPIPGGRSTWTGKPAPAYEGASGLSLSRLASAHRMAGVTEAPTPVEEVPQGDDGLAAELPHDTTEHDEPRSDDALIVGGEQTAYSPTSFHAPQFVRMHDPSLVTVGQSDEILGDHEGPVEAAPVQDAVFEDSYSADAYAQPEEENAEAFASEEAQPDAALPLEMAAAEPAPRFAALLDEMEAEPVEDLAGEQQGEEQEMVLEVAPAAEPEPYEELVLDDSQAETPLNAEPPLPRPYDPEPGSMKASMALLQDALRRMNEDDPAPSVTSEPLSERMAENMPEPASEQPPELTAGPRPLLPS